LQGAWRVRRFCDLIAGKSGAETGLARKGTESIRSGGWRRKMRLEIGEGCVVGSGSGERSIYFFYFLIFLLRGLRAKSRLNLRTSPQTREIVHCEAIKPATFFFLSTDAITRCSRALCAKKQI
jgi:hypothetical protein